MVFTRRTLFCAGAALALASCGSNKEAPSEIVFGQVTSLTGHQAQGVESTTKPVYEFWIQEMNEKGGLYVEEFDKRIPIRHLRYDDESNIDLMESKLEQLILEDKVDFLLPPWSTAFLTAAAPIANKYGYILMGGAGGSISLQAQISGMPYFFSVLNGSETQMPALADLLEQADVKRVAIIFVDELHGIEYSSILVPALALKGIDVVVNRPYISQDPDVGDTIAEVMIEAMALEADAFIGLTYPDASFPAPGIAMSLGFNPKVFHLNVGPSFPAFREAYGVDAVDGIVCPGIWTPGASPEAQEFSDKFNAHYGYEPDFWGSIQYYSSLQFLEAAIGKAGTLDHAKIREVMATETFDTAMGPIKFVNGIKVGSLGEMGQWQDGVMQVIGPVNLATADMIPKPAWPPPPAE